MMMVIQENIAVNTVAVLSCIRAMKNNLNQMLLAPTYESINHRNYWFRGQSYG